MQSVAIQLLDVSAFNGIIPNSTFRTNAFILRGLVNTKHRRRNERLVGTVGLDTSIRHRLVVMVRLIVRTL